MRNVLYGDVGLQSIRLIFEALITIGFLKDTPPEKFKDIPTVDVYQDDWKAQLKDQDEAWIITPLHYFSGGKRIHRKALGGGTWNNRDQKEKNNKQATWCVRKFKFVESTNEQQATNDGTGLQKYTMIEYLPKEDKPQYALCRITVKSPSNSHDQQPKIMEIDHTDSNNGERGETSLSQESLQIGGNFENATEYYNLPDLEMFFARVVQGGELSEFMKHFSKDDIVQVFSRKMDQIPAASPKEHSTEAALRNPRKRSHGTTMKTIMEADVSTQRQKQTKVEVFEQDVQAPHNVYNFNPNSTVPMENRYYLASYNQNMIPPGPTPTYYAPPVPPFINQDTYNAFEEQQFSLCNTQHGQMVEPNADVQEPNNLSHNINTNSTKPTNNWNNHPIYNQPSTSYYAIIENWFDLPMVEPNVGVQEPNPLSQNLIANSTEPIDNQNRTVPNPSTSFFSTTEGRLDHQDPDNLFVKFMANSMEGMENSNQHPCYHQNTIAPGLSTSNHATTVPENIGSNNIFATIPSRTVEEMYNSYDQEGQINFHADSAEGMENNNQLLSYNHNTIVHGPSTSNHATIVPEFSDWNTWSGYFDLN